MRNGTLPIGDDAWYFLMVFEMWTRFDYSGPVDDLLCSEWTLFWLFLTRLALTVTVQVRREAGRLLPHQPQAGVHGRDLLHGRLLVSNDLCVKVSWLA